MSGWKVKGGSVPILSNFIFLLFLASSFTLSASDLAADLMLGFNGSIKLGSRAPVSVSLINSGKGISGAGDYFITIFDGGAGKEISTKTLGLALSYSPEYIDFKVNISLLTSISEQSGGRVY